MNLQELQAYYGAPGLRPHEKHAVILEHGERFGCTAFIETGTEFGDTVEAARTYFSKIWSIELGPNYYQAAVKRFASYPHIKILLGDSSDILPSLLPTLKNEKVLFYLDAHWKYDSVDPKKSNPTSEELETIFACMPDSIILIDDARTFTGLNTRGNSTPRLDELESYVLLKGLTFRIEKDIIRIHR